MLLKETLTMTLNEEFILHSLLDRDRYGGEISELVSKVTQGIYKIPSNVLYPSLQRLSDRGFITSYYGEEAIAPRRKYHAITENGRLAIEAKAKLLKHLKERDAGRKAKQMEIASENQNRRLLLSKMQQ